VHLTLEGAIDAYLASEEYEKLRSDRKPYHEHWKRRLGDRKLGTLNRAVYQSEAEWLVRSAGPRGRSRQTVAVFMSSLGKILKYATRKLAADARALAEFRCCSFGAQSRVRGRALEPTEIASLLSAADAARWRHWGLLVRLLLITAARKGDLLKRCRRDVDVEAGTITVPVTKNGDPKVMFIVGESLDLLRVRCAELEPDDLLFDGRKKTTPLDPKKS
jgi:integrase